MHGDESELTPRGTGVWDCLMCEGLAKKTYFLPFVFFEDDTQYYRARRIGKAKSCRDRVEARPSRQTYLLIWQSLKERNPAM